MELLSAYCDRVRVGPEEDIPPVYLGGYDTLEFIWPLSAHFTPRMRRVMTAPYREKYELAADETILGYVLHDVSLNDLSDNVMRVLLERHHQLILLGCANALDGNTTFMPVPHGLPLAALTKYTVAFWWYQMRLPFAITDHPLPDISTAFEQLSKHLH